jgi:hypothetical protein
MKWCCAAFEGRYHDAGKRGAAVFVDESKGGEPMFVLQFRAVDVGVELSTTIRTTDSEALISPIIEDVIQYCPWCGRHLMRWYKKDLNLLVRRGLRIPLDSH